MTRHRHFPRNSIPISETVEAWLLVAGIALAVYFVKSDLLSTAVAHAAQFSLVVSFVEGFFFTSILTTTPAIVAILESAAYIPAWKLALVGGIGAVCGDMLVFRFVQSKLVEHILRVVFHPRVMRFGARVAAGPLWWLGPLCGTLVIASPLPDEIGLLMMGLSHIRLIQFIPLSFIANAGGIYIMAIAAQRLV